jgi:hypothetical protein
MVHPSSIRRASSSIAVLFVCFRAFENRKIHGGPLTGFAIHRNTLEVITSIAALQTVEKREDFCANGRVFVDCTDTFGTFFFRGGKSKPLPKQKKCNVMRELRHQVIACDRHGWTTNSEPTERRTSKIWYLSPRLRKLHK